MTSLRSPTALLPEKEFPVSIRQEDELAQRPVQTRRKRNKSLSPSANQFLIHLSSIPKPSHYTNWAILIHKGRKTFNTSKPKTNLNYT
jgi:hypothetical protein